jgi:predicted nucleic acid-binding protein
VNTVLLDTNADIATRNVRDFAPLGVATIDPWAV